MLEDDAVKFTVTQESLPDPPDWLTFTQSDLKQDGFLYGSPRGPQDSTVLQIVAVNKRTFRVSQSIMELEVPPESDEPTYIMEFKLKNIELKDIMDDRLRNDLLLKWGRYWSDDSRLVLRVIGLSEPKGTPQDQSSTEILIKIGGNLDFSNEVKRVQNDLQTSCALQTLRSPPDINRGFAPQFNIDWCSVLLIDLDSLVTESPITTKIDLQDSDWEPYLPEEHIRRDLKKMFLICVIFPIILGFIMFVIFSIIMFGRREGVEKRNKQSTPTQMMHFNTIRQATSNLRLMSAAVSDGDTIRPISRSATPASNSATRATTPKRSQTDLSVIATNPPSCATKPVLRKKSSNSQDDAEIEIITDKEKLVRASNTQEKEIDRK